MLIGSRRARLRVCLPIVYHSVEGAELAVIRSLAQARGVTSFGVVSVEVRGNGDGSSKRRTIFDALLTLGFSYAGVLHAGSTLTNAVSDDVFVNVSHLRRYWPDSSYLHPVSGG